MVPDVSSPRLAAISAMIAVLTPTLLDVRIPFFNAPITVIGMAAAGATMSFAFGLPEPSRKRLFGVALASMFLGTCAVTIVPAWLNLEWVTPVIQPPLAFFLAFIARWCVPLFVEVLPSMARRFTGTAPTAPPGGQP
jgi:hypothetical protein